MKEKKHLMFDNIFDKVLDKITEIKGNEKSDDTKILIDCMFLSCHVRV